MGAELFDGHAASRSSPRPAMPTPEFTAPRRLLVTGDDFGVSSQVNTAIEQYHRAGALDQASLMVAAPAAPEAAEIARRHPGLRVGLHLTLCDGLATAVSALTDEEGRLPASPARAGLQYSFFPWLRAALREEIHRQFERFIALGFAPTYWDGHTHLHLHPVVVGLTLPIARQYGFTATRLVREPGATAIVPRIFERLSATVLPALRTAGISFADRVFGLQATGHMDLAAFQTALSQAGPGTTEIYFHPGAEANPPDPKALAACLADWRGK